MTATIFIEQIYEIIAIVVEWKHINEVAISGLLLKIIFNIILLSKKNVSKNVF